MTLQIGEAVAQVDDWILWLEGRGFYAGTLKTARATIEAFVADATKQESRLDALNLELMEARSEFARQLFDANERADNEELAAKVIKSYLDDSDEREKSLTLRLHNGREAFRAMLVGVDHCRVGPVTIPDNEKVCDLEDALFDELPAGAVSVVKPQGTEETGDDRPAAPISFASQCRALGDLPPNWDSYGAVQIDAACIDKALKIYDGLPPGHWDAVPCNDGGVQIEQHANGFDIEIMVSKAVVVEKQKTK